MSTTVDLPRWRLEPIFPGLDSAEFRGAVQLIKERITELERYFDASGVTIEGPPPGDAAAVIEGALARLAALETGFSDVAAYLHGLISTDSFNERAHAARSSLQPWGSRLGFLHKRLVGWLGRVDLEAALASSEVAEQHRYFLSRARSRADRLLGDEAEALASALDDTGGSAWARLHGALISRETVRCSLVGREDGEYNVAELKQLQADGERAIRRAAYQAELELLARNGTAFAAAMNSIKGQVGELAERRGWASALEESLFASAMTRASLEAMQAACRESFPVFRRYLGAKARLLGLERLAWYDLFAPIDAGSSRRFGWDEARRFIIAHFRLYSDRLAAFAERAFAEGWLDAPSHKGKTNGAYCMGVPGRRESRIMLNFGGTLDDVFTIAHELGHAFHNDCMYRFERTPQQRATPMTLAETASTFCETLVANAMLEQVQGQELLGILEQDLVGTTQILVDIDSRFRFEAAVFERRRERELSVDELKELMLEAQQATYGEALADERHPFMWAHKGHYYSSTRSFYNYPYTFGLLFGLGLYREFREQPARFQERYEELLSSTGMADAPTLARRFGIDVEDREFWRGALSLYEERVATYERLVDAETS